MSQPNLYSLVTNSRIRAEAFGLTEHFTEFDLQQLLDSCGYQCMCCQQSSDDVLLSVDHVVPLTRQGRNTPDNLQVLCKPCNSRKFDKIIDYRVSPPLFISGSVANIPTEPIEKPIPLMVRLPPPLHVLVDDAAKRQHRSLNAQIIHIISWYFGGELQDERTSPKTLPYTENDT